jgi:DNA-binding winged helix-turn-helix (wHTH) protein
MTPQQNLSKSSSGRILQFAGFEVDFSQKQLRKSGARVPLQPKPFQILELLLRSPGLLVTRQEMARHLWPDSHVSTQQSLNTAVNVLRQALGDVSQTSRMIETRSGLGYVFAAPVALLESSSPAPRNSDYLKGRYLLNKLTEEDTAKAIAYFESVLLDDDRSALACAGLADAWCEFARLWMTSPASAAVKARDYAVRALSHDSEIAESHVALARVKTVFDADWKVARFELKRALEIDVKCAAAHRAYAHLLSRINQMGPAFEHIQEAQELEPLSLATGVEHGWLLYADRRYNDAAEQCWRLLSLEPRFWTAQLLLSLTYHELGLHEEALAEAQNSVTCSGRHPVPLALLGYFDPGQANPIREELASQAKIRYVPPCVDTLLNQQHPNLVGLLRWHTNAA